MKKIMKRILIPVFALLICSPACNAISQEYEGYYTLDSDNLLTQQHVFSVNRAIRDNSTLGLLIGFAGYKDSARSENTQSYQLSYRNKVYGRWIFSAQGGFLQYLNRSMPVFGGSAVYTAPNEFRLETTVDKSIVNTFISFDNDISAFTLFACADIPIHQKFMLIAGADSRSFSDGNERAGLLAKGIFMLPSDGLSLQVWHRQFRNTKADSIGYFNPETINFQRYIAAYRTGLPMGLRLSIKTGPGTQQVNNDSRTATFYFEGGLEKFMKTGLSFKVNYIYTDSFIDNNLLSYKINIIACNFAYSF